MKQKKRILWIGSALLVSMMMLGGCGDKKERAEVETSIADTPLPSETMETNAQADPQEEESDEPESGELAPEAEEEEEILAPDFELVDAEGNMVSLSDYRGQVVVLNVWASWCPPCKAEMPEFQEMHEEWQAEKEANPDADVPVLIAMNMANGYRGETKEQAIAFLKEQGYTFLSVFDESEYSDVAGMYSSGSIPITYIIDKEGYARDAFWGQTSRSAIEASLDALKETSE